MFPGKAALLFQKSSSLAAACLNAKTLSYWSEDLTVPNPSKTSYGRYATVSSLCLMPGCFCPFWLRFSYVCALGLIVALQILAQAVFPDLLWLLSSALKISFSFRPCLLWGADLGRHVPLLHAALSRSFSMEEAPSWDSSQDSTRLGKTH